MKKNKKRILALILALALAFSLVACGGDGNTAGNNTGNNAGSDTDNNADSSAEDIVLGFIGSMTGDDEIYGYVSWGAIKMAVDRINEAGGVAGRKVVLKLYDDRADGVEAVNCCRKAILEDN